MSTPSKFDMGGIPRTKTGLVPASWRSQMEDMSTPKKWSQLPAKPKPEMYPFRGDYVNERNRKLTRERKKAQEQRRRLIESYGSDSCGSTLLVSPRSSLNHSSNSSSNTSTVLATPVITKKWDSYCKHISCHRLSDEEMHARTENNNKATSYLRTEASKRQGRKSSEKKKKEEGLVETSVRKRKPPVPRLSRLARSGHNKENQQGGQRPRTRTTPTRPNTVKESQPSDSKEPSKEPIKENVKPKVGYLDFISKKINQQSRSPTKTSKADTADDSVTSGKRRFAAKETPNDSQSSPADKETKDNNDAASIAVSIEEDDSQFRAQIERIVERAAEMVLSEQGKAQTGSIATAASSDCNDTQIASTSYALSDNETKSNLNSEHSEHSEQEVEQNVRTSRGSRSVRSNDFFQKKDQHLSVLEEKIKSIDILSACSSKSSNAARTASHDTVDDSTFSFGTSHDSESLSQMMPRAQNYPTNIPTWQQCLRQAFMTDPLCSTDCSSSTHLSELETTIDVSGNTLTQPSVGMSIFSFDDISTQSNSMRSLQGSETATEVIPRTQIYPSPVLEHQPSLETCQEEPLPPPINPSIVPSRQLQWEDEPLPRGYEHVSQLSAEEQHEKPESLADDLLSLFS